MSHIAFWFWTLRVRLCDLLPGAQCWIHGGVTYLPTLSDDDPCWDRAGWSKP